MRADHRPLKHRKTARAFKSSHVWWRLSNNVSGEKKKQNKTLALIKKKKKKRSQVSKQISHEFIGS